MTRIMTASKARAEIFKIMDETASSHEPVIITGKRNNVVMVSEEDWNALQETLYLNSVPGLKESIVEGLNTPIEECDEELEW